nr:helix-turn-helix domain-containing protein [Sinosporangium siamense]
MGKAGLPRMAARVLARLFVTDSGGLTAAELVRHLGVSPASVSKAVTYLEGVELVRRERTTRQRRERYLVDDDVWFQSLLTTANAHGSWADVARRGAGILGPATQAGARLDHMARFFARLSADMTSGIDMMNKVEASSGVEFVPAADDAMTVLAALAHAGVPLSAGALARALGWGVDRVESALRVAGEHPGLGDPVALRRVGPEHYGLGPRTDRLSVFQREALGRLAFADDLPTRR